MSDSARNVSMFHEYNNILVKKLDYSLHRADSPTNISETISDVKKQLELLSAIGISDEKNLSNMLLEINQHFTDTNMDYLAATGKISRTKERILIDSLKSELTQIITICKNIKNVLLIELELLKDQKLADYKMELNKEHIQAISLKKLLDDNKTLEAAYQKNLTDVKKLLQSDNISSIFHRLVGLRARLSNRILKPIYESQDMPLTGPVVFAPRHYGISGDITLLMDGIPRRVFTIQAAEWVRSDFVAGFYRNVFERSGFIPTIRPESREQYNKGTAKDKYIFPEAASNVTLNRMTEILSLNQALIIFPEGHPNITPAFTYKEKDSGIIPLKPGLAMCLEIIENTLNKRIPVIPVGIIVDTKNKTLQAKFGKPMYYVPRKGLSLRESLVENKPLRDTFSEALRVEIARLSEVGLSEIPPEKLYKKEDRKRMAA